MSGETRPEIPEDASGTISSPKNDLDSQLGTPTTIDSERVKDFSDQLNLKYPVLYFIKNN
jgi:hypothetical protein